MADWLRPAIKNWSAVLGSYDDCPDIRATWFVDPPYQTPAGRHYPCDFRRHAALGEWCDTRRGMVIACDQQGADWRPWNWSRSLKGARGASQEVAWVHGVPQLSLLEDSDVDRAARQHRLSIDPEEGT